MGTSNLSGSTLSSLRERFEDRAINAVVAFVNKMADLLNSHPLLGQGWRVIGPVDVVSASDNVLTHGLGRVPSMCFPVRIVKHSSSALANVSWTTGTTTAYDPVSQVNFKVSADCKVTLFVC